MMDVEQLWSPPAILPASNAFGFLIHSKSHPSNDNTQSVSPFGVMDDPNNY